MHVPRIRVYIACSLDGFIAGLDDDLSWLSGPPDASDATEAVTFETFMAEVGVLLMGRRTYDVVRAMDVPWPYGDIRVLVATHRALPDGPATVRGVSGTMSELVRTARQLAGDRDVYVDGGNLVRQALDAGVVDEVIVTMIPIVLGAGIPLFAGVERRQTFEFVAHHRYHGFLQYIAVPAESGSQGPSTGSS